MLKPTLIELVKQLSAADKAELIQLLAEDLQRELTKAKRTVRSPVPSSKHTLQFDESVPPTKPVEPVKLAVMPDQPKLGKMSAESTMQLSISDLIETEEDRELADAIADEGLVPSPFLQTTDLASAMESSQVLHIDAAEGEDKSSGSTIQLTVDAIVDALDGEEEAVAYARASGTDEPPSSDVDSEGGEESPPTPRETTTNGVTPDVLAELQALAKEGKENREKAASPSHDDAQELLPSAELTVDRAVVDIAEDAEEEEVEEAFRNEDTIFESLLDNLSPDEFRVMETLSVVRRLFWAPLQEGFKALDVTNIQTTVDTMRFAPMRIAIGELVNTSIIALVQNFHDFLNQHFEEIGVPPSNHRSLFVTKKSQSHLDLALRAPFRDYIERLERLDEARDALIEALKELSPAAIDVTAPILTPKRKQTLEGYDEALGIKGAWQTLLDAVRFAVIEAEASVDITGALSTFSKTMERFLAQLDLIYRDVLDRVLEIWGAHLMAPARAELPNL